MDSLAAISSFSALAQPTRLAALQGLIRNEPDGLAAGALAASLNVPDNTLSTHLGLLSRAGLVTSERRGRSIVYRANIDQIRALGLFLLADCCGGRADECEPLLAELLPCC
ncbi:MAG: transcriptional regulator [Alphaproteobacteria bacterium]|nr:MAG: transcriptional regulator [Alphaproteobacteria bacterium]